MRLSTVQIKNFRGLRDVQIELTSTTLLIGENNCGKTSFLDAIRLALSRTAGRKTGTFDPYDYHLGTRDAEPQAATPISITLTFDDIEALPGRISDLLTGTQVNVCASSGASIPLVRHGAGTQSLSVLFLFQAYLSAMLQQQFSELSSPLLALEEPEAHLHPFATRSLWSTLNAIPGQKIVASHSGDLVANAPLSSIRRLYTSNGHTKVGFVAEKFLDDDEERKIQFHVTTSRGELLFARCWLLYEGESEHWITR
jgi:predicted ATP-dependent endonuclease of OLD family